MVEDGKLAGGLVIRPADAETLRKTKSKLKPEGAEAAENAEGSADAIRCRQGAAVYPEIVAACEDSDRQ